VDVRIVLAVTITIISLLQFMNKNNRYEEAVKYAMQNPKFRNQALQIIHQEGLLENKKGKVKNKRSKDEKKREEERVLREVVENSIDIKGGYSKATFYDVAWIQLLMSPYTIYKWCAWYIRWIFKFKIMKQEYGEEEKEYLTCTNLGLSSNYWSALDEDSKEGYMERELWLPEKFQEYKEEQEEEMRVKMAESGRYKMWRRYMKAGGPGQMTFGED
jgi:DnaJ family protein C protein 25